MNIWYFPAGPGTMAEMLLDDADRIPIRGRSRSVFGPYRSRGHVAPVPVEKVQLGHRATTPLR